MPNYRRSVPCPRLRGHVEKESVSLELIYRKKCKRFDIPGHAHYLTFSCFQRQSFFLHELFCQYMLDALRLGKNKGMYYLLAYVIMPEHVHVIIFPKSEVKISQILSTIKQSVSKRALLWIRENSPDLLGKMLDKQPNGKQHFRLWQRGGGYDRNLRNREDIVEKIKYIHENPFRRGLVKKPDEWKWSSCYAWRTGKDDPISIDRGILF